MTVFDPATNAIDTDNFRFMPPDKNFDLSFRFGINREFARNLVKRWQRYIYKESRSNYSRKPMQGCWLTTLLRDKAFPVKSVKLY